MRIANLFLIGTSGVNDLETRKRIVLVNKISLAFGLAILAVTPTLCSFVHWKPQFFVPLTVEFLINGSVLLLNHYRKYSAAGLLLYFLQCAAIIYFSSLLGSLIQLELAIILLISILYLIFKEVRLRRIALAGAILDLAVLEVVHYVSGGHPVITLTYNQAFILHVLVDTAAIAIIIMVSKPYIQSNDSNAALKRANHFIKLFVAEITHELRTPLDNIHQVVQLLKKEVEDDHRLQKIQPLVDIGYIVSSSARNIVNNVLDMACIEAGMPPKIASEAIEVIPFFKEIMMVHKTVASNEDKRLRLDIDMPRVIFGDPLGISQILTNLLANALKYGSRGTTVTVRIKRAGDTWEIVVSNYGLMVLPDLDSIFDPFVTGRTGHTQGSGLGLFIVKNKALLMGGSIHADSQPGGYTTFTVSLPLVEGRVSDLPAELSPSSEVIDLRSIRVMVAEDNNLTAFLLSTFLEDLGCRFDIVSNGRDLLELAQKKCPDECPDIILLDSKMPVLGGEETIRLIKRIPGLTEIPIIISTADIYSDAVERMLKAGANTYLKKPLDHLALKKAINLYVKKIPLE